MKVVTNSELRSLDAQQLAHRIEELRRKLLELRLSVVTSHVAAFSSTKNALRTSIARALTVQAERLRE